MKNFLIPSGFKLDYSLLPKVLLDVLFAFVLLFCNSLQAKAEATTTSVLATTEIMQKKTIAGKVVDTNGEPIIGANVSIKGTTTGTITDPDGNFSLAAPAGTVLQISYIGFLTQSVPVDTTNKLSIQLQEDSQKLDEVVVIGYGTKTKATTTGSVDVIGKDRFENKSISNAANSLQGVLPGVQITRANASRIGNESYGIEIRGTTSRANPGVLVIIDGIPEAANDASAINKVNPQDIESITVLKDAQAAIYGARAAGGVILITTKSGKSKKPTITYSGDFSFVNPASMPKKVNLIQHAEMLNQAFANDGNESNSPFFKYKDQMGSWDLYASQPLVLEGPFGDTPDLVVGPYHDWMKEMYGTAFNNSHNVSITGGSDKSRYYASVGYLDENSMLQYGKNDNKKLFGRFKYDYTINDYLTIRSNLYLARKKTTEPTMYDQVTFLNYFAWNNNPIYNDRGQYYGMGGVENPVAIAEAGGERYRTTWSTQINLGFDLKPVKGLVIKGDVALNNDVTEENWSTKQFYTHHWDGTVNFPATVYHYGGKTQAGSAYNRGQQVVASLFANYNYQLKDHTFDLMAGTSHEEYDGKYFNAFRKDMITDKLDNMTLGSADEQFNNESTSQWALTSLFSRLNYNFKKRYFIEATYRNDGSSRFADGHKWADFWGISGAWIFSEEKFFSGLKSVIDYAKLRGSWGQLGNQAGIGLYDHYSLINIGGQYPFGNSDSPSKTTSATIGGMPAVNRTWETINVYNVGLDLSVLDSRLGANFDYFVKDNPKMFYSEEYPSVLGTSAPQINGAHVRTNGYELSLNWKDKIDKVKYRVGFTLSDSKSKVMSLSDSRNPGYGHNTFVEGYEVGSFFLYEFDGFIKDEADLANYQKLKGIPTNLRIGDAKYKDNDGDGTLEPTLYKEGDENSGDIKHKGSASQHYLYGVTVDLEWNNFDLRLFGQGVGKWMVQNGMMVGGVETWIQRSSIFFKNTWTPENTHAEYPSLTGNGTLYGYNLQFSDAPYRFSNNPYFRLKELQIGYTLPKTLLSHAKIEKVRLYVLGTDLFELDNQPKGFDPEAPFAERLSPFTRTVSFGINITL